MKTDTSERGLERLICTALTGAPCDPARSRASCASRLPAYGGTGWICGDPDDYDREYCVDLAQLRAFLQATQPKAAEALDLDQDGPTRRKFLARLQGEIAQARRDRRAAPRRQARAAPPRPLLRHALARQREGRGALRGQPLQRHPAAPLQPRRDAARARPVPLHQRPAGRHLRAEEQPDQADGRGRRRAVQARPRPARAAVPVRPLRRALRRGRPRGAVLHAPEGQGLVVPALQPGLERRRGQPAQPGRPQDRLPVEAHPHAATA